MKDKSIGNFLANTLESKNITQVEFAKKMNISPSSLSKYIKNRRQIPVDLLVKFAEYLDISLDEVFELSDKEHLSSLSKSEIALLLKLRKSSYESREKLIKIFIYLVDQSNK